MVTLSDDAYEETSHQYVGGKKDSVVILFTLPDVEIEEVAWFTVLVGNGSPVVCLVSEKSMVAVSSRNIIKSSV